MKLTDAPVISVIIPVYNTEQDYLVQCFENINEQSFRSFEVIVVDDGSSAATGRFLDKYAKGKKDWKVIHRNNSGGNRARQTGFEASTGLYIAFIDSDDRVDKCYLEKLLNACQREKTDMSICNMKEFVSIYNPEKTEANTAKKPPEFTRSKIVESQFCGYNDMHLYYGVVWAKLYKRNVIEKLDWDFSDYKITHDEFITVQINTFINGVAFVSESLYFYRRQVARSLVSVQTNKNKYLNREIVYLQTAVDFYDKILKYLNNKNIKYNNQKLKDYYSKVFINKVERLLVSNTMDKENYLIAKHEAGRILEKIKPRLTKKELFELKLISLSPELYSEYLKLLLLTDEEYRTNINNMQKEINKKETQIDALFSIKNSTRRVLGNILRWLRN